MKSLSTRFLLPFGVLTVLIFALVFWVTYAASQRHANQLVNKQLALALEFDLAVRSYAANTIRPVMAELVDMDRFIPQTMSTSFISRHIFEEARSKFPDLLVRFPSENPRNPENLANPDELSMIEHFRLNRDVESRMEEMQLEGRRFLVHFAPRWLKAECMRCHGDPQDAPAELVARYGATAGFHRSVGDVAALDMVAVPIDAVTTALAAEMGSQSIVLAVGLALLFGSIFLVFRFTVTRRLEAMAGHFNEIAAHAESSAMMPVAVRGNDEISVVGVAFNRLINQLRAAQALLEQRVSERTEELRQVNLQLQLELAERKRAEEERLRLEQRLHQTQKAESLGRMAGAIAHHFNNLLGTVMGRLEMALGDLQHAPGPLKHLSEAMKASQRAAEISRLMLTYLGHTVQSKRPCDAVEAVREALLLLTPSLPQRVRVNAELPLEEILIKGDKVHIEQALTNLLLNAEEAIGDGAGEITVTVEVMTAKNLREFRPFPSDWEPAETSYVSISIADTGCGFDPDIMQRLFDPFFSTKFTGRGLGLAVVLGIVRAHGGALAVESEAGRGSIFRVFLPLPAPQTLPPALEPAVDFKPFHGAGLVLVAEDESVVRDMAEIMLKEFGYEVMVAGDGLEALEKFRERHDEVCLALLDESMPRMNGWETLTALRALRSALPVILTSGYDEAEVMEGDHPEQPQVFLHKPYRMKDLEAALDAAQKTSRAKNKGAL